MLATIKPGQAVWAVNHGEFLKNKGAVDNAAFLRRRSSHSESFQIRHGDTIGFGRWGPPDDRNMEMESTKHTGDTSTTEALSDEA